jgi:hypothetical protein
MNLLDLLQSSGGENSVGALASKLGLNETEAKSVVGALSPTLIKGIQEQALKSNGLEKLAGALKNGSHKRYIDEPDLIHSDETREDGNKILGHLLGSKAVSRKVAAQASRETGIADDLIKKALPLVAGMAMGALSKKKAEQEQGGLGDLLGGLLGGGGDGFGADDVVNLARKFF